MMRAREILRQKWKQGRTHREVAASLDVSPGSVGDLLGRAHAGGLREWGDVERLNDDELEARLYASPSLATSPARPKPDPARMHVELRKPGVTLQLLHVEYLEKHPGGYRYTVFCDLYRRWLATQSPVMRQVHRAGDKLFVDYSGNRPTVVDPQTGEVIEVELFVAVLGASNLTYAEATRTQKVADFVGSHIRALAYFGGVPRAIVCDQLKSGVTVACRYEPAIQKTYAELAEHYGTVVMPARPRHPRDKAKVEAGVLVVQRWILARLRHQTFFSLDALNERIAELVDEINVRPMRRYRQSRRELFEQVERAALSPLPITPFVYGEWKLGVGVNIDYHIDFDGHYYSVHHRLLHEKVDVRATPSTVEIFQHNERIASHPRSYLRGQHSTHPGHMPRSHREHAEWTPSRLIGWACTIGPETAKLVEQILSERPHPQHGFRSCLGILRLGKRYGHDRLEAACARALSAGARSYRHVDSILKNGLDRLASPAPSPTSTGPVHENVRGPRYYQ